MNRAMTEWNVDLEKADTDLISALVGNVQEGYWYSGPLQVDTAYERIVEQHKKYLHSISMIFL